MSSPFFLKWQGDGSLEVSMDGGKLHLAEWTPALIDIAIQGNTATRGTGGSVGMRSGENAQLADVMFSAASESDIHDSFGQVTSACSRWLERTGARGKMGSTDDWAAISQAPSGTAAAGLLRFHLSAWLVSLQDDFLASLDGSESPSQSLRDDREAAARAYHPCGKDIYPSLVNAIHHKTRLFQSISAQEQLQITTLIEEMLEGETVYKPFEPYRLELLEHRSIVTGMAERMAMDPAIEQAGLSEGSAIDAKLRELPLGKLKKLFDTLTSPKDPSLSDRAWDYFQSLESAELTLDAMIDWKATKKNAKNALIRSAQAESSGVENPRGSQGPSTGETQRRNEPAKKWAEGGPRVAREGKRSKRFDPSA